MRTVKVRLNAAELSDQMIVMREWLDRNRYEAKRFDCDQHGDVVVLSVDFTVEVAAEAFAMRFDGVYHSSGGNRHDQSSSAVHRGGGVPEHS
jgi:hypothetical protein